MSSSWTLIAKYGDLQDELVCDWVVVGLCESKLSEKYLWSNSERCHETNQIEQVHEDEIESCPWINQVQAWILELETSDTMV